MKARIIINSRKVKIRDKKEVTLLPKFDKTKHPKVIKEAQVKKEHSSIFYLTYFLIFVGLFVGLAFIAKLIFLIRESTFTNSSYSILIKNKDPYIISFSKTTSSFSLVSIPSHDGSRVKKSIDLGVPIDGEVIDSSNNLQKDSFPNTESIVSVIFKPWKYFYKNMTVLDFIKLNFKCLSARLEQRIKVDDSGKNDVLYNIFKDSDVINEELSINIVNSTSKNGLAGDVSIMIKNLGGNVVQLSSGDVQKKSEIIAAKNSKTLERTSRILGIRPTIKSDFSSISDIKITIGEDFLSGN